MDATETLSEILLYGMPDERRFREVIESVLRRGPATAESPAVIDEMAGQLWLDGRTEAAMRLVKLWQELAEKHHFSLCCVYPISSSEKIEKPKVFRVRAAAANA